MAKDSVANEREQGLVERIDPRRAIQLAREFLVHVYEQEDLPNLRLEEIELSDDGAHWLVTLGFTGTESEFELGAVPHAMGGPTRRPRREYKLIRVDAYSGEPESMKIREP